MTWNLNAAVAHLQANAQPEPIGYCGQWTREAIEAGGVTVPRPASHSAKDYGPGLLAVGFLSVHTSNATPPAVNRDYFGAQKGDVVVMSDFTDPSPPPGYAAYHQHGHMQMYDGSRWISDFRQSTFYPGPPYRRAAPAYVVFRFPAVEATPPYVPPLDPIYSIIPETPYSWLPDYMSPSHPSPPGGGVSAPVAPRVEGTSYTVVAGDSLGLIALNAWNDALLWPLIHDDNFEVIGANPNAVTPGTAIVIRDISNLSDSERTVARQRGRNW